jgi:hypothetical protein
MRSRDVGDSLIPGIHTHVVLHSVTFLISECKPPTPIRSRAYIVSQSNTSSMNSLDSARTRQDRVLYVRVTSTTAVLVGAHISDPCARIILSRDATLDLTNIPLPRDLFSKCSSMAKKASWQVVFGYSGSGRRLIRCAFRPIDDGLQYWNGFNCAPTVKFVAVLLR